MTQPATRCIILLLNLQNKFGWKRWRQQFMCAHKLMPLTFMPMCLSLSGKNIIFPQVVWEGLQGTNTLAYLSGASVTKKKNSYNLAICSPSGKLFSVPAIAQSRWKSNKTFFIVTYNGTSCIRLQCRKTTVLSSHRCLINTGVEKMNNI